MEINEEDVERALATLKQGGVLVFPTETSYGLGCDATNPQATERIMRMKDRPRDQALSVLVSDRAMVEVYGKVDPVLESIIGKHWPGPLTIVFPTTNPFLSPDCVHGGTIAMRISSHPIAQRLVTALGKPLVATSANVHGHSAAYSIEEARKQFAQRDDGPDAYLDGGVLSEVPASMIIECVKGEIVVHRMGSFKL